jgi:poly(A) polymerase
MSESNSVLDALRAATRGTEFEGRLFLVGGFVRDRVMGLPHAAEDLDIVLEGDALAVARLLRNCGAAEFEPVAYPRFGTVMVRVAGRDVELVTARKESYAPDSRKPDQVTPGTLLDDTRRRDFTINTLLQNLHTGEVIDPLGTARTDIATKVLRTPVDPLATFRDDPLRMLRAVRFAARFGFTIADDTWTAIRQSVDRLQIISAERIRDEFCKTLMTSRAPLGLELLKDSGLLAQFAPELLEMVGVIQNEFHVDPVWEHTLKVVELLPPDAPLALRLAALLHDSGKPRTRTVNPDDHRVHFYHHQDVSAEITGALLARLKFPNAEIAAVRRLVQEHMRIGEYKSIWSDSAVRRLIRDLDDQLEDLFTLHRADVGSLAPDHRDMSRAVELRARIDEIQSRQDVRTLDAPLDGRAIMTLLGIPPGPEIGRVKDHLTDEVIEGRLAPDDRAGAERLAIQFHGEQSKQ